MPNLVVRGAGAAAWAGSRRRANPPAAPNSAVTPAVSDWTSAMPLNRCKSRSFHRHCSGRSRSSHFLKNQGTVFLALKSGGNLVRSPTPWADASMGFLNNSYHPNTGCIQTRCLRRDSGRPLPLVPAARAGEKGSSLSGPLYLCLPSIRGQNHRQGRSLKQVEPKASQHMSQAEIRRRYRMLAHAPIPCISFGSANRIG